MYIHTPDRKARQVLCIYYCLRRSIQTRRYRSQLRGPPRPDATANHATGAGAVCIDFDIQTITMMFMSQMRSKRSHLVVPQATAPPTPPRGCPFASRDWLCINGLKRAVSGLPLSPLLALAVLCWVSLGFNVCTYMDSCTEELGYASARA